MWVVMMLKKDLTVSYFNIEQEVKLSFADGMIGAIPVFDTEESAKEFSGGLYQIIEITIADRKGA